MKSNSTSTKLPTSASAWAALISEAPEAASAAPSTHTVHANSAQSLIPKNAVVVQSGGYAAVRDALTKKRQGQRGPQLAPIKLPVTLRLDPDVVAGFRATGSGWQTRVNDAMREWLKTHSAV